MNTIVPSYIPPAARYYNSDLSIWLSVDPLVDKYPNLSPYTYCANNPVKLVDPDGRVPIYWPRQGTNIFFCKAKIGAGVSYGLAGSIIGGIALDQHGMTHWTASNSKYFTNQNLYDGSLQPAIEVGCDISISLGFERHTKSETFLEAINDVAYSLSFSGKYIVGGDVTLGDNSYGASLGIGIGIGAAADPYNIIESVSLSKKEAEKVGYTTSWTVCDTKYMSDTQTYTGRVKINNKKTSILVTCNAIKINGNIKPSGVWFSNEYEK